MDKCIVLFSNGLDSRLVVKIMQEKKFEVLAAYFKLPFIKDSEFEVKDFCKEQKIKLKVFDCTKGKLFKEYLETIKKAKHGTGSGMNPCIDCKIFMFTKVKEFAKKKSRSGSYPKGTRTSSRPKTLNSGRLEASPELRNSGRKINFIATGEVVGQRPMSQMQNSIKIIEKEAGLENKIVRPLIDLGFSGRQRKKQIALAKKFKINYPSPAGGCLLCEKGLKNRFEKLFKRNLNQQEIKLINIGRHFFINNYWIVLGRNEKENKIIEKINTAQCTPKNLSSGAKFGKIIIPDFIGGTAIILDEPNKISEQIINKTNGLIKAYSKKGNIKQRKKFKEFKI